MLFFQFGQVSVVVFLDVTVADHDSGPKALINEIKHGHLPEKMIVQLVFREAVTLERRAETSIRPAEAIFPDLIQHGCSLCVRRAAVAFESDFIPDYGLVDQVISSLFARRGAQIERLVIQEFGHPQLVFNIAELDCVLADDDSNAVKHHGARKTYNDEGDEEYSELRHQNVCPIEKKN